MPHLRDQRGVALVLEVILIAIIMAVAGFGVYIYIRHQSTISVATNSSPSPSSAATPDIYAGWKTYTSSFEKLSFKYPPSWTPVAAFPSNIPSGDAFAVQSPGGHKVSWISAADGLGGACNTAIMPGTSVASNELGPCPYWTVTDKAKVAGTNLYYVAGTVTIDGSTYRPWCALQASNGIVQNESDIGYLMFTGKNNGPNSAALLCGSPFGGQGTQTGTKAQAEALLSTPDYRTAKNILLSATY